MLLKWCILAESDNESTPTFSPIKCQRSVKVKTLEEIKLERIQAESAAYYSYQGTKLTFFTFLAIYYIKALIYILFLDGLKQNEDFMELSEADDLRQRILSRFNSLQTDTRPNQEFSILSLKDIRKRKMKEQLSKNNIDPKRQKFTYDKSDDIDLNNVKIKTLSEIRAEKAQRVVDKRKADEEEITSTNSELSSSSLFENIDNNETNKTQHVAKIQPTKRLKRSADDSLAISERKPKLVRHNVTISDEAENNVGPNEDVQNIIQNEEIMRDDESKNSNNKIDHNNDVNNLNETKLDEVLLLEDEESEDNVTLKAEEDILKDIDELLNG